MEIEEDLDVALDAPRDRPRSELPRSIPSLAVAPPNMPLKAELALTCGCSEASGSPSPVAENGDAILEVKAGPMALIVRIDSVAEADRSLVTGRLRGCPALWSGRETSSKSRGGS